MYISFGKANSMWIKLYDLPKYCNWQVVNLQMICFHQELHTLTCLIVAQGLIINSTALNIVKKILIVQVGIIAQGTFCARWHITCMFIRQVREMLAIDMFSSKTVIHIEYTQYMYKTTMGDYIKKQISYQLKYLIHMVCYNIVWIFYGRYCNPI